MKIGIPTEVKVRENRVSLVLSGVKALKAKGHEICVQSGAGEGSGISDQEYLDCGARIVQTAAEAWDADMVIKVKEPIPEEYQYLKPGLLLYTYLHLAAEPELGKALVENKVRSIAYETIQLANRALP